MFEYAFCSCYFVLHVVLHPCVSERERLCVCVCVCVCTSAEICLFIRLQVFEEVTPGGSHYVSACPLQVGRQSDIYHQRISAGPEDTKLAHSLWLGKVFAETNLTKMCTLQRVLK